MLHDLANDGDYVALKLEAEDREGWRHRERMSTSICTAQDDDNDDDDNNNGYLMHQLRTRV